MSDLSNVQAEISVGITGLNVSGVPTNLVDASVTGDLFVRDCIDTSLSHGTLSISTTAVEAKIGATRLVGRKMIMLTPTSGNIYLGGNSSVTSTTGTPILKGQTFALNATDSIGIYIIGLATTDVRIIEAS